MTSRYLATASSAPKVILEDEPGDVQTSFDVDLPAAGITLTAHRVWMGPSRERDAYWWGVEVADTGTSVSSQWQAFVNSVN